jgi:hypothetical protein
LEILSQTYPTKNRAGGVAQVVECLPSKCETLNSNTTIPLPQRNEGQEGKIGLFQGWVPVGRGEHKKRVNMVDVFCIHI